MPDSNARYFKLHDDIGVDKDGNPEPIHEVGITFLTVAMRDGEPVQSTDREVLKPIPGTRTLKTTDPRVAEQLLSSGQYDEVDAPSKTALKKERSATQDARENAGTTPDPENEEG